MSALWTLSWVPSCHPHHRRAWVGSKDPPDLVDDSARTHIVRREPYDGVSLLRQFPVAGTVVVESPHVRVVLIAVELNNEPPRNQKVYLADTADPHTVSDIKIGAPQLDARQRLQRAARSATRPLKAPASQRPTSPMQVGADLFIGDLAPMECSVDDDQCSPFLGAAQKIRETTRQGCNQEGTQRHDRKISGLMLSLTP